MLAKKIKYQEIAIGKLISHTNHLINNEDPNSLIIFKSPTGSGKTVMMAQYIKSFLRETEEDVCFVWISIGKGELQIQSKNKIESIFQGFPEVTLLDEDYFGSKKVISPKEVVVVNWEKIRGRSGTTGEWKNTLMRDGEQLNFRDVLSNTHATGRKVILIIDESHIGRTSQRTEEIKQEIKASLLIEMTATPLIPSNFAEDVEDGKAGFVKVNVQDVIDEEMIKKRLVVNEGLIKRDDIIIDKELLHLSYEKRESLKRKLVQEGSSVNPLVIIQLPNSQEGESKKEFIIQSLKDRDITLENRKLAIWLSDSTDKINLESITNKSDSVEFLLFKQAVDTGWDCPRASILLKFRETSSETFERQTLGRILRMPEQKHYNDDELNKAYVYTDYIGSVLEIIDKEFEYPDDRIDDIALSVKSGLENITLISQKIKRKKKNLIKEVMNNSFQEVINDRSLEWLNYEANIRLLSLNTDLKKLTEKIITEIEIGTGDILEKEKIDGVEVEFNLDEFRTQKLFDKLLKQNSNSLSNDRYAMQNILKENVYKLLAYYIVDIYQLPNMLVDAQRIFILNYQNVFFKIISDAIAKYRDTNFDELVEVTIGESYIFNIAENINVNSKTYEKVELDKYFYNECYLELDRTKPEKIFEEYISSNLDQIKYWVKNGNHGSKYFSIPYQINEELRDFYPDYIIVFEDDRIGLFETKDKGDNSDDTKSKAEFLYSYIQDQKKNGVNIIGGIVADFGTNETPYLMINTNEKFSLNQSLWLDLDGIYKS